MRIHKPPPLDSLYLGSRYTVSGSEKLEITPKVSSQMSTLDLDQILDVGSQSEGFPVDQES